jgi:cytochrome c5
MATLAVLLACIARAPHISPEVLAVGGAPPEAEASLMAGRETFVAVCDQCHLLPAPKHLSSDEWPAVIEKMRTKHHAKVDDAQKEQILAYIDFVVVWDEKTRAAKKSKSP